MGAGPARDIPPGKHVHITGAKPDRRNEGRAYSIDETLPVSTHRCRVTVPLPRSHRSATRDCIRLQGEVRAAQEPRSFTSRDGTPRGCVISVSVTVMIYKVVLWGEKALVPVHPGDRVRSTMRRQNPAVSGDRTGCRGSILRSRRRDPGDHLCGTIIAGNGCTFIDDGTERYLIAGISRMAACRVHGILSGSRITPDQIRTGRAESGRDGRAYRRP